MMTGKYEIDDLEYIAVFRVVDGQDVDLNKYFSQKRLDMMVPFEREMYVNKIKNFLIMKQLDGQQTRPDFMKSKSCRTSANQLAADDSDEEWKPKSVRPKNDKFARKRK